MKLFNASKKKYNLTIFADYHQFYIQDEKADGNLSESWTEEATTNLLAHAPGTIGIGTIRNSDVPVMIEVIKSAPDDTISAWDQVIECSIDINSGKIVVAGCTDYFPDAQRIPVKQGCYRARIYYGNLNPADNNDHYKIILWPHPYEPINILKPRDCR